MNYLLIDIGNTKIKYSLSKDGVLQSAKSEFYIKSELKKYIISILRTYNNKFEETFISSLDNKNIPIIRSITNKYKTHFISVNSRLPLKIDYARSLGSDRICSSVGAYLKFNKYKNILVIDLGTATTFNMISKGVYLGGMISVGINTSVDALLHKTSLPAVVLNQKVKLINKTTKSAVISGIIIQQVLFIQKAIEEYKKTYKDLFVVATGGGIKLISKHLKGIDKFEDDLVIQGLNHIALYNENIR